MSDRNFHFVALIHKDAASGYGLFFPDVPGVIAGADSLDEAIAEGAAALQFAFEDWEGDLAAPRTLEELQKDDNFRRDAEGAAVAIIRPSYSYYAAAE